MQKGWGYSHLLSPLSPRPAERQPFIVRLRLGAQEAQRKRPHPWAERLRDVHGTIESDHVERVSTQQVFDLLAVPQKERTPTACRALNALMLEQGWTAVRFRTISRRGYRDQVRGFARPAS
jgi:hypothetical protein